MPRHKQYYFYARQYQDALSKMDEAETGLLLAWEEGDQQAAAFFETEIGRLSRRIEGLDFSVQYNTVRIAQ